MAAAELSIVITGDSSSAKRAMQDLIGEAKKTESAFKNIATTAAGFLSANVIQQGFGALTNGLKSSWNAAQETVRVQQQLNAALKSTGGAAGVTIAQLNEMSSAFQDSTRYTDEEVGSVQALMLTFTNIKSDIFPQTTKAILDMSTAMGQDLQSSTIQVGKALNDPIAGMTALQRVGVTFTEQQKDMVEKLVNTGHGLEAQKLILKELNAEFGGSAEAMTEQQKAMDDLKDVYSEFQETVGFVLIGALAELSAWFQDNRGEISDWANVFLEAVGFLADNLSAQIGGVVDAFNNIKDAVESAINLVDDLIHGRWQAAWEDLIQVVVNAGKALLNTLVAIFGKLPNIIIGAVNDAIELVNKVEIPKVTVGIGPLSQSFGGGSLNMPTLPTIPTRAFDLSSIQSAFEHLADSGREVSGMNTEVAKTGRQIPPVFNDTNKQAKDVADGLKNLHSRTGPTATAVQDFGNSLQTVTKALDYWSPEAQYARAYPNGAGGGAGMKGPTSLDDAGKRGGGMARNDYFTSLAGQGLGYGNSFYTPASWGAPYERDGGPIQVQVMIDNRELGRAIVDLQGSGGLRGVPFGGR